MTTIKNIIYSILDLVSFNKGISRKINNYDIRFPAKWFRYFEADYEKENIAFLTKVCKKDMTIIDIGAHLGLMSVIMAKLIGNNGKVLSYEPTPKTFILFKKIISLNKFTNVIIPYNMAISNFKGLVDFFVDENEGSNANSLVGRKDKNRVSEKIQVNTLDNIIIDLKLQKLDLIKIDAEGSELDVLNGAVNTISKFKPIIILALHPPLIINNKHNIADIYDFIIKYNYEIVLNGAVMDKETFCTKQDFFDVHLQVK